MMNWIERFPQKKVVVLRTTDTVFDAAKAMTENEIGCVLVANARGGIVGICTDRDLVCESLAARRRLRTPLSEMMTRRLVTAEEGASVEEVINLMIEAGVRRIPLIAEGSRADHLRCVGLVSLDDLIANRMADELQLAMVIISQIKPGMNHRQFRKTRRHQRTNARAERSAL
jgi:CBS domain-containing protein